MRFQSVMDIIECNLAQLKIIQTNFRKAPNRKYRRSTLLNKLAEVQTLRNNINNELITLENTIAIGTFDQIRKIERSLTGELQLTIDQKLANLGDKPDITLKSLGKLIVISYRLTKSAKMATLIETVKTVTALLPTYDGTPTKLRNFLDALECVYKFHHSLIRLVVTGSLTHVTHLDLPKHKTTAVTGLHQALIIMFIFFINDTTYRRSSCR